MKLPNHIAIIMDGNGRWGVKRFNSRLIGHQYGIKNIKKIIDYCLEINLKNITFYALSYDNLLKRDKKEIVNLFNLLEKYLKENILYFQKNKIKLNFIGEKKNLPKKILKLFNLCQNITKSNKLNLVINVAVNYSSKKEILNTFKKYYAKNKTLTENNFKKELYTFRSGDPDIVIRTGGHNRLSDFLLYQSAYAEIFFLKKLWPDFRPKDLKKIIQGFNKIKRNFGS